MRRGGLPTDGVIAQHAAAHLAIALSLRRRDRTLTFAATHVNARPRFLLGLILVLGAALRLALYLSRPSYSIDETMLGLEIGTRSFAGLLHPLDYAQTGPPLFLFSLKVVATLAGMSEYALRAIPLAAGLLLPYLVWRVGRRVVGDDSALLAAALAALAPTLVQYSVIVKPYLTDASVALALLDCALTVLDRPSERGPWAWLALVGLGAVLGSVPAPLLLSGVAAALFLGAPAARLRLGGCLVFWSAVFVPLYMVLYRPVAASDYMQRFWGASFFTPAHGIGWQLLGRSIVQSLVARPAPLGLVLPVAVLVAGGFWSLARARGRAIAALLGIPVLALLVASALQRYPLSARLLLGIVPTLVLCCAAGVAAVARWHAAAGRGVGAVTLLTLAAVNVTHPYRTPAVRPAVIALRAAASPTDPIYLSSGAIPAWAFYTADWSAPDSAYLREIRQWAGRPEAPAFHNSASRGRAVTGTEGDPVAVRHLGRLEILGLAPGIQWREVSGLSGRTPDAGWADREAARIRGAAPAVWLLIANSYAETTAELLTALEGAGGRVDLDTMVGGVRRLRIRFAPDSAAAGAP